MKKLFILLVCFIALSAIAQNEIQNQSDVVLLMDGIGYSKDNAMMYILDVSAFLSRADSAYVGMDSNYNEKNQVIKKAIIYFNGKSGVIKLFVTSNPFPDTDGKFFCSYGTYLDVKGLVHELFYPRDNMILDACVLFLLNSKVSR